MAAAQAAEMECPGPRHKPENKKEEWSKPQLKKVKVEELTSHGHGPGNDGWGGHRGERS
jgi:hypothetical protein